VNYHATAIDALIFDSRKNGMNKLISLLFGRIMAFRCQNIFLAMGGPAEVILYTNRDNFKFKDLQLFKRDRHKPHGGRVMDEDPRCSSLEK